MIFSILLIILGVLPFIKNQHWTFRVSEFMKIHLFFFQIVAMVGMFIWHEKDAWFWLINSIQLGLTIYHGFILFKFTSFYKKNDTSGFDCATIKIISTNIYQFNTDFKRFKDFIKIENPDIFITIESNADWEKAMREMETDFPHTEKITLENTYGMHFYSKMPFEELKTHFFVSEDIPSIEAHFKFENGEDFVVFAVHPPPPSPTEENTSKERDGDLLSIAKRVKKIGKPVLVIGDFNTVAWSNISSLFRKNSGLIDGRVGRGILASFHAKYWFVRIPVDLVFHSTELFLKELKILEDIGSDHFPIRCEFGICKSDHSQEDEVEHLEGDEHEETEGLIEEGKKEKSENR